MFDLKDQLPKNPAYVLENVYRRAFTTKHKQSPGITEDDKHVFQWLIHEFGAEKATKMVEVFFKLTDPFIVGKGHPVKLLKTNSSQVIAALGASTPTVNRQKMIMKITLACDKCFKDFEWIGDHKELEAKKECPACRKK